MKFLLSEFWKKMGFEVTIKTMAGDRGKGHVVVVRVFKVRKRCRFLLIWLPWWVKWGACSQSFLCLITTLRQMGIIESRSWKQIKWVISVVNKELIVELLAYNQKEKKKRKCFQTRTRNRNKNLAHLLITLTNMLNCSYSISNYLITKNVISIHGIAI